MTSRVLLSERRSPSHDQAVSVVLNRAIGPTCPWSPAAGCLLGSDRRSAEKWTEPGRRTFLVPLAAGNGEDGAISLIDPRVRAPGPSVHLDEKSKGHPCRTLVAVEERMVLGQPDQEHGCLVDEVRIDRSPLHPSCPPARGAPNRPDRCSWCPTRRQARSR